MKKNKIIYWIATGILGAMMLFSAFGYFANEEMKAAFVHLGFPGYFRIELAIAKIIGALVLLIPFIPKEIKDMAYVGFAITFISAFIAHTSSGDPLSVAIMPIIFLGILVVSFIYSNKYKAISNVGNIKPQKEIFDFK
ncbi:MAG: DoxX family protein [Segetibacter sp.]